MTIRVLLADDQNLIRAGFRVLIDAAPDLEGGRDRPGGRRAHPHHARGRWRRRSWR
jgi:DNA-binding NarL/FixJ family response regulator